MVDFKKLGDVEQVEEVQESDTVLVVRDGEVYRADQSQLGGGGTGGMLLVPGEGEVVYDADLGGLVITTANVDDLFAAYEQGANVAIQMDAGAIEPGLAGIAMTCPLLMCAKGGRVTEMGVAYMGAIFFLMETSFSVYFTNGGPVPSQTAATSLMSRMGGGAGVQL